MQMEKKDKELQLEEDLEFLRKDWKFERIGWVLMLVFLLAALAGVFGRGGLIWNETTVGNKTTGIEIEYSEVWRKEAPEELILTGSGADTVIEIYTRQMDMIKVENMLPQPERSEFTSDKITLFYQPVSGSRTIHVHINPLKFGRFKARVKAGTKEAVNFSVFIYP